MQQYLAEVRQNLAEVQQQWAKGRQSLAGLQSTIIDTLATTLPDLRHLTILTEDRLGVTCCACTPTSVHALMHIRKKSYGQLP